MDDKRAREDFIAKSVDQAMVELADIRKQGKTVCDITYIEGTMAEAARKFDSANKRT